jgi:hypothetical protein
MSTLLYLESSAVLGGLLENDHAVLAPLARSGAVITSAVTAAEVERGLLRALALKRIGLHDRRSKRQWLKDLISSCEILEINREVLERSAEPFPVEPIRMLDAIHLASIALLDQRVGLPLTVLSLDRRVRENALEMGFEVLPRWGVESSRADPHELKKPSAALASRQPPNRR